MCVCWVLQEYRPLCACVMHAGTSASTAAAPRRAFRRVGRGKRVFVSIRTLAQQDAAAPPAPAAADKSAAADAGSGMTPAGALPAECSGGSCRLWNLNRIGAPAVWRQMGSSMPLANVARPGSIIGGLAAAEGVCHVADSSLWTAMV